MKRGTEKGDLTIHAEQQATDAFVTGGQSVFHLNSLSCFCPTALSSAHNMENAQEHSRTILRAHVAMWAAIQIPCYLVTED